MNQLSAIITDTPKSSHTSIIPDSEVNGRIKVNILWSGGFDSTFRMVELSKMDIDIQPYYLVEKRISEKHEMEAISLILEEIGKHPETKGHILPLKRILVSDLKEDQQVSEAYRRLYSRYNIGSQYDWLGRFSRLVPGIELGKEKSVTCKLTNCLQKEGSLIKINEGVLSYCIVDKENSSPDLVTVFENFRFPFPLIETTKLEMVEIYKQRGYEKLMHHTWFCHTPIKNKPCGICNPCVGTIQEGLSFRFSEAAIKRYHRKMKYGDTWWFRYYMKSRIKLSDTFNEIKVASRVLKPEL